MREETGNDTDVGYVDEIGKVKCIRVSRTGAWIWKILEAYYSDMDTLVRLIGMGDCFYFARNIGPTTWQPGETPGPNVCKFYRREQQRNHYNNDASEVTMLEFFRRGSTYKFLFYEDEWYTLSGEYLVVPLRSASFIPRALADVMASCRNEPSTDRPAERDNDEEDEGADEYSDEFASAGLFTN